VLSWFKPNKPESSAAEDQALLRAVHEVMPQADQDTLHVVAASAGLLACVAFADRDYSATEETRIRELLTTIEGLDVDGASAILLVLRAHARAYSTVQATRFCRTLRQLGDRDLRVHVLELLVEVAAADHEISHNEVTVLRQLTTALGLEQRDYNAAQEKHRAKIAALR